MNTRSIGLIGLISAGVVLTAGGLLAGEGWPKHVVAEDGRSNTAVGADFTGDGQVDVIASSGGMIRLYIAPSWYQVPLYEVERKQNCIHSEVMDVDGDGDPDFIGAVAQGGVFWLENPGKKGGKWTHRLIDDEIHGIHCTLKADVDMDGRLDLLVNNFHAHGAAPDSLTWLEMPKAPRKADRWQRHVLAKGDAPGGNHYFGFGDLDGDGRPDVAVGAKGKPFKGGNYFAWWKNPKNPRGVWKKSLIAEEEEGATNILPADLNGDGVMDMMASRGHGRGVLWFEGPDWKKHEVDLEIDGPHSLLVADIDQDGDVDAATCTTRDTRAVWYENDGSGRFTRHVVGEEQAAYDIRSIDMDGDGDLDLLIAGQATGNVVWYENRLVAKVSVPPAAMNLDPFYKKYISAKGYPVVSSGKVNDYALKEAAHLINMMLSRRPDVKKAMIDGGSRMIVMAHDEYTTDVPEHSRLKPKDYWDARARGLGGDRNDPVCSCGEENLLGFEGDPYWSENILIHEFAHNIHLRGMVVVDSTFDRRLKAAYKEAMSKGLWKGKYASVNSAEYFAEGVQSWFDNNRQPDHDHNHVDTREELLDYDPKLAALCEEVFGDTKLVYTKPVTRLTGHLEGYDPTDAPRFKWPKRLTESKKKIREKAESRGKE